MQGLWLWWCIQKSSPQRRNQGTTSEGGSARGLARKFGVSHQTSLNWIKKAEELPDVVETLLPYEERDVLELDELWSFVYWAMGDRNEERCRTLWDLVPKDYKRCMVYSDFCTVYQKVLADYDH